MHHTFFVFLKCTIQGGSKVDVLLIAFLHLWLKFCKGYDKYWIVPVRKLFYFHHCLKQPRVKQFCQWKNEISNWKSSWGNVQYSTVATGELWWP